MQVTNAPPPPKTYAASEVSNDSGVAGTNVDDALDTLDTAVGGKLDASSYTAADVLSKVSTVDGSGSGLDADTVDGSHASAFAAAAHNQAASTITDFAEAVSDQVGTMVTGNTETGISVTYQDTDNTLDFVLDSEYLQDLVGAMVSGNTETNITVTYQDADGTIDFEVPEAGTTTAGVIEIAVAAEVEGATDSTRAIVPSRAHFSPSACKAWGRVVIGVGPSGYNLSSVSAPFTGGAQINFATSFSSVAYGANVSALYNPSGAAAGTLTSAIHSATASSMTAITVNLSSYAGTNPTEFRWSAFGDL